MNIRSKRRKRLPAILLLFVLCGSGAPIQDRREYTPDSRVKIEGVFFPLTERDVEGRSWGFSSDGKRLVLIGGPVRVRDWIVSWDLETGAPDQIKNIPGLRKLRAYRYLECLPSGKEFVVLEFARTRRGEDPRVHMQFVDLKTGKVKREQELVLKEGDRVRKGGEDLSHTLRAFSKWVVRKKKLHPRVEPRNPEDLVGYQPNIRSPFHVGTDLDRKQLVVWDIDQGKVRCRIPLRSFDATQRDKVKHHVSDDQNHLVVAAGDRVLEVYDLKKKSRKIRLAGHQREIEQLAVSPNGECVATFGQDGTLRIWDTKSGKERVRHPVSDVLGGGLRFSPDGTRLVAATKAGFEIFSSDGKHERAIAALREPKFIMNSTGTAAIEIIRGRATGTRKPNEEKPKEMWAVRFWSLNPPAIKTEFAVEAPINATWVDPLGSRAFVFSKSDVVLLDAEENTQTNFGRYQARVLGLLPENAGVLLQKETRVWGQKWKSEEELWSMDTGQPNAKVRISDSGKLAAVATDLPKVIDLGSGKIVSGSGFKKGKLLSAGVSADGERVVTLSAVERTISFYSLAGELQRSYKLDEMFKATRGYEFTFVPGSKSLIVRAIGSRLVILNPERGAERPIELIAESMGHRITVSGNTVICYGSIFCRVKAK